jgi:hypothetical protein
MRYIHAELASVPALTHARRPDCQQTSSHSARPAFDQRFFILLLSISYVLPLLPKKNGGAQILRLAVFMLSIQDFCFHAGQVKPRKR